MAKRFTETDKWDDDWFLNLPIKMKVVWQYLCDTCDGGTGIKKISFKKLSNDIGERVTREEFNRHLSDRVHWVNHETVWIPGFLGAQFKELRPTNRAHVNMAKKVVALVAESKLSSRSQKVFESLKELIRLSQDSLETLHRESTESQETLIGYRIQDKGKKEGGVGETNDARACFEIWKETLRHRGVKRDLFAFEQTEIARQILRLGAEAVKQALYGFRFEESFEGYNAKTNLKLARVFDKDKIDKWINLAASNTRPRREVFEGEVAC